MNLLARKRENLSGTLSAVDEMFQRFMRYWMQDEPFSDQWGTEQAFEVGEKEVRLALPCPGKKAENIDIEIVGNLLTVKSCFCSAGPEKIVAEKERSCVFSERCTSMCVGSYRIPVKVIGKEAKAQIRDGVLTVTIPRDLACSDCTGPIRITCE